MLIGQYGPVFLPEDGVCVCGGGGGGGGGGGVVCQSQRVGY